MDFNIVIILICFGFISNILSALFGLGGGVILVPLLITFFPILDIQQVAATSLSIVVGTALINLIYFLKLKIMVNLKNVIIWSLAMIIGVQIGFELSFKIPRNYLIYIFAITMFVLSIKTFIKIVKSNAKAKNDLNKSLIDTIKGGIFCTIGGAIAGLTGIGGGSIMAPLISQLRSVHRSQVAVYSNYLMVIGGIGSIIGYLIKPANNPIEHTYQVGYINFSLIAIVLCSSFITSFFSMRLRKKLNEFASNLILGCILLAIGVYSIFIK